MARAAYNLQVFKKVTLTSANETTYQARIWTSSIVTGKRRGREKSYTLFRDGS